MIYWERCSKYGFEPSKQWYEHRAEGVIENQDIKILWDINISTDRVIEARCPDIVLIDKKNQETLSLMWLYLGIFVSGTSRLKRYQNTKILHWKYLECGKQELE